MTKFYDVFLLTFTVAVLVVLLVLGLSMGRYELPEGGGDVGWCPNYQCNADVQCGPGCRCVYPDGKPLGFCAAEG